MKVIDLRPDSKLLKSNFDGYKLSLEPIPIIRCENIPKPHVVAPDTSSEYSFLHSSLYQLQNHLVSDPWLQNSAYFLDSSFNIQKIFYDNNTGKLKPLSPVFRYSTKRPALAGGVYNCNFKFISEKFSVLSDGFGKLHIIETGDRQKNDEWKSLQVLQPLDGSGFIIQDAKFAIEKEEKLIHCLLLHIESIEGKFYNIINWITLKQGKESKIWELSARRTIQGRGNFYYLSLDPKCTSIVYSTNQPYKYTLDTVNEIVEELPDELPIENLQVDDSNYEWTQDQECITVDFKRPAEATKDQYSVVCQKNHISVKHQSETLIDADLFSEIDTDMTTWSLESDSFQVTLVKKDAEAFWPFLVPGGPFMKSSEKVDPPLNNAPVSDLNAQMEDCDYGDDGQMDEEFFIGE
jgi:CS domain